MFWRMSGYSATSPVETILDKTAYTLEELLDEDQTIQECKATNSRLITYLRGRQQIQQMIHYVIDEPPDGADRNRSFKYPFVSCQIFTCEVEAILKTLVEDDELLTLLFSFLDPTFHHGTLLAGYFSKVVICLLVRKTIPVMQYLQTHQDILKQLVDLIGITSIKEVLMRLVGADDHIQTYHGDALEWLAETNLLEMLVDKLSPLNSAEVHANTAETLTAVSRTSPSALAIQLASPRFVAKLLNHALEDPQSKSALIHSLSVCISLLDPKRAISALRGHQPLDALPTPAPETLEAILQSLNCLFKLLDVSEDDTVLPTTYGQLKPPFGIHRLKIVELVAVLLRTNSEDVRQELIRLNSLQAILGFFFDYPFNNMLHGHVECIITSCLESLPLIDNLFEHTDFVTRLLATDDNPFAPLTRLQSRYPPKVGNMGHITRIANKLVQAAATNAQLETYLQTISGWDEWQFTTLQERNIVENVYQWACGRPAAIRERPAESDDEEFRDRDYVTAMANNLTREVFRYGIFDNDDSDDLPGTTDRDDEDIFFDDDAAEVVISSLRLSGNRGKSWAAQFSEEDSDFLPRRRDWQDGDDDGHGNEHDVAIASSSGCDDEVVVGDSGGGGGGVGVVDDDDGDDDDDGEDDVDVDDDVVKRPNGLSEKIHDVEYNMEWASFDVGKAAASALDEVEEGEVLFGVNNPFTVEMSREEEEVKENEGSAKAMESALKEGIVGEAGPIKPKPKINDVIKEGYDEGGVAAKEEFNDVNYWRSDYDHSVATTE